QRFRWNLNCGIEEQLPFGLMIGATAEAPPLMKAVATRWRGLSSLADSPGQRSWFEQIEKKTEISLNDITEGCERMFGQVESWLNGNLRRNEAKGNFRTLRSGHSPSANVEEPPKAVKRLF
ncbi:MAG: hypothetical protein ACTS7D_01210, partial [Candidatus Hodgkinia cicadicola]